MPQGIFAWQEKGQREAHPEGEQETGRRPRERGSTFLGEKPVPDASGEGLSLCASQGQERGKKTPLGAGGGGPVPPKKGKGKGLGSISQAFPSFRGGGAALSRGLYYFNESFP